MTEEAVAGTADICTHSGYADGDTVVEFRQRIRAWLRSSVDLDPERVCDIVLATDEALSNVVDHAYRGSGNGGVVTLELSFDAAEAVVKVCVTDRGHWLEPTPTPVDAIRGRGLILMHALADSCAVDGRVDGTSVSLIFRDCPALEHLSARFG
ncbi:MAG: ATP-binding protein [Mycobacterium sp.]